MPTPIRLRVGDLALDGELNDDPIALAVAEALPIVESLRTFGDAYYLETPVEVDLDAARTEEVAAGDLAYWPAALAVMVFFGPTPESAPGSDRPAPPSEVTVIGRVAEAARLRDHRGEAEMRLERR